MPGINRAGTAQPNDYLLGRGALYFSELDGNDRPLAYRFLGNASAFSANLESETIQHQSSRSGLRFTDKEVPVSQTLGLSLTLEEINFDNLALLLSGEVADANSTTPTVNAAQSNVTQYRMVESAGLGRWYDLVDSNGARLRDIVQANLTVKTGTGSTAGATLVRGAQNDYTVDEKWGRIFLVSTGSHPDGDEIYIAYTSATTEKDVEQVRGLTKTSISGALKFISKNPANDDFETEYQFRKVTLTSDGDFNLIGDEWTEMQLTGTAESAETAYPDSPVVEITTHGDA